MANALKGKTLTTWTVTLPNEEAVEEMLEQASGHLEFMEAKSFQNGPLKLIHYSISTSPEWKEHTSFLEGKMPEQTGRFVVTLFEIYETAEGLHNHWIESKEIQPIFETWLKEIGGEIKIHSHQKIIQSLWD